MKSQVINTDNQRLTQRKESLVVAAALNGPVGGWVTCLYSQVVADVCLSKSMVGDTGTVLCVETMTNPASYNVYSCSFLPA